MKHTAFIMPLFTPDIMEYITGRDIVCQLVLAECKLSSLTDEHSITLKSKIFTELHFSPADLIETILAIGVQLSIKFSYDILLKQHEHFTVEDLATELWKYMCRVVKAN